VTTQTRTFNVDIQKQRKHVLVWFTVWCHSMPLTGMYIDLVVSEFFSSSSEIFLHWCRWWWLRCCYCYCCSLDCNWVGVTHAWPGCSVWRHQSHAAQVVRVFILRLLFSALIIHDTQRGQCLPSVCLFVCSYLFTVTQKVVIGFGSNFEARQTMGLETHYFRFWQPQPIGMCPVAPSVCPYHLLPNYQIWNNKPWWRCRCCYGSNTCHMHPGLQCGHCFVAIGMCTPISLHL